MAWIELHQTLPSHRKIKKLKRLLKIKTPQAVGHVVMLWLWSIDNATDGDLSRADIEDIAEACEWTKDPEDFIEAMKEAELIDRDMRLHDWDEYAGRLMDQREERREKERDRKAKYRARKRAEERDKKSCPEDVPRDSPTQDGTVPPLPNLTKPNQTKPVIDRPPPHAPAGAEDGDTSPQNEPPAELSEALLAAASAGRTEPDPRVDPGLGKVMTFYMNRINPTPSQTSIEELAGFVKDIDPDVVIKAMEYALDEHKTSWSYIRATLRAYKQRGIRTLADWQRANDEFESAKLRREDTHNASTRRNSQGRPGGGAPAPGADPLRGFHTEE